MYLTHNCIIMLSLLANKLPLPPLSTAKLTDFSPPPTFSLPSHFSLSLSRTDFSTARRSREKLLEDVGETYTFWERWKGCWKIGKEKKNGRKNVYFSRERDGERFQTRMA